MTANVSKTSIYNFLEMADGIQQNKELVSIPQFVLGMQRTEQAESSCFPNERPVLAENCELILN